MSRPPCLTFLDNISCSAIALPDRDEGDIRLGTSEVASFLSRNVSRSLCRNWVSDLSIGLLGHRVMTSPLASR